MKTRSSLFPLCLLVSVLTWLPLSGCATLYHAEAIESWVVDAETNQPLEGVIIVANWGLRGGFEGNYPVGQLQILETVTDQTGRYFFPAWGPKVAPSGHLGAQSPRLLLFKPGYKSAGFTNLYHETMKRRLLIIWDGLQAHRSRLVREHVDSTNGAIELAFLPPYAPELNPVEYLWAWLKRHALANFCPNGLMELAYTARNKLKSAQRRRSIIVACWQQAELF